MAEMESVSIEREFVGRDIASTGLWWRVDGQLVLEPEPDALAIVRREVFEAQRRWAIKTQIVAGRLAANPREAMIDAALNPDGGTK